MVRTGLTSAKRGGQNQRNFRQKAKLRSKLSWYSFPWQKNSALRYNVSDPNSSLLTCTLYVDCCAKNNLTILVRTKTEPACSGWDNRNSIGPRLSVTYYYMYLAQKPDISRCICSNRGRFVRGDWHFLEQCTESIHIYIWFWSSIKKSLTFTSLLNIFPHFLSITFLRIQLF